MKYYLLSKVLKLDRFFQSLEEIDAYVRAKTGIQFFSIEFVEEYLQEKNYYSYQYRGIDIAIFKRNVSQASESSSRLSNSGNIGLDEQENL